MSKAYADMQTCGDPVGPRRLPAPCGSKPAARAAIKIVPVGFFDVCLVVVHNQVTRLTDASLFEVAPDVPERQIFSGRGPEWAATAVTW
jgi:hypothetical protein